MKVCPESLYISDNDEEKKRKEKLTDYKTYKLHQCIIVIYELTQNITDKYLLYNIHRFIFEKDIPFPAFLEDIRSAIIYHYISSLDDHYKQFSIVSDILREFDIFFIQNDIQLYECFRLPFSKRKIDRYLDLLENYYDNIKDEINDFYVKFI
jgi:hypothetical protein